MIQKYSFWDLNLGNIIGWAIICLGWLVALKITRASAQRNEARKMCDKIIEMLELISSTSTEIWNRPSVTEAHFDLIISSSVSRISIYKKIYAKITKRVLLDDEELEKLYSISEGYKDHKKANMSSKIIDEKLAIIDNLIYLFIDKTEEEYRECYERNLFGLKTNSNPPSNNFSLVLISLIFVAYVSIFIFILFKFGIHNLFIPD